MATPVIMPKQGQSVESCIIGQWHKQEGDAVNIGDVLFTYETDKAVFDEQAAAAGTLLARFFEEGDDVTCLTTVCVIGSPGEDTEQFRPGEDNGQLRKTDDVTVELSTVTAIDNDNDNYPLSIVNYQSNKLSPRARILAAKTGADVSMAVPGGANGRIMEQDIQNVLDLGRTTSRMGSCEDGGERGYEDVKLTNVRKFIAKSMHASISQMAQLTHHTSFDASDLLGLRAKLKTEDNTCRITVTDIIVYALSRVLPGHKNMNAHFMGDFIRLFEDTHIGIAVDTPRGLLVPTLSSANKRSLSEISREAKSIFDKCKQGSIEPDLLNGAGFTVSNLGTLGIEMFTPIINPPQTGILGVCSITERTRDGGKFYPAMGLSLTYDHRAMDGADASRFLRDLTLYLENISNNVR